MIIYKITNILNSKIYIGLTTNTISRRFNGHKQTAKKGLEKSRLYNSMRKYGSENFKIELVYTATSIEDLKEKEIYYINLYNTKDDKVGYNIIDGGDCGKLGYKMSEESKDLLRQKALLRKHTQKSKDLMSKNRKGIKLPGSALEKVKEHNNLTSKIVIKTIDNLTIEYKSVSEAARQNNIDPKSISRSLNANKRGYYIKKGTKEIYKFK